MKKREKKDWFEEGLRVLADEGFQKITINHLCSLLQITQGSFYHHFKNIDGYIEALMEYWWQKNTVAFIKATEALPGIAEKGALLNDMVASASLKAEQVIRAWSFSNETVRCILRQVDNMRVEYLTGLNIQSGITPEDALRYALLEYGTLIGLEQLCPDLPKEEFRRMYQIYSTNMYKP
ncbi:MAG: TetR/AcrR family transcriptional regulator [Tannerella sp.]|jgi:AcrR family transcriptional regulator|nr:TetR/AcrR family transcriptional regulator [Tannerella sp.]